MTGTTLNTGTTCPPHQQSAVATAATLIRPESFQLHTSDVPDVGPHDLRVRLQGCGVCGSDLAVYGGRDWFSYPQEPGAPGHEGWGRIEAVGSQVADFRPGQRVACLSTHAYAEVSVLPADQALVLPPELDSELFPAEPLACAMNVLARCQLQPEESVAVVGVGFLGALLIQLATHAGARVLRFPVAVMPGKLRHTVALNAVWHWTIRPHSNCSRTDRIPA